MLDSVWDDSSTTGLERIDDAASLVATVAAESLEASCLLRANMAEMASTSFQRALVDLVVVVVVVFVVVVSVVMLIEISGFGESVFAAGDLTTTVRGGGGSGRGKLRSLWALGERLFRTGVLHRPQSSTEDVDDDDDDDNDNVIACEEGLDEPQLVTNGRD